MKDGATGNAGVTEPSIRDLLNAQTGRLSWPELERHFARGVILKVAGELDLVDVAACLVDDDKARVNAWMESGDLARARTDDARHWQSSGCILWAVVAAPWVLVQEESERHMGGDHPA